MTKQKKQKPIQIDAHLKYKCPNDSCGFTHWLTLNECKTKNFKVVCDCGVVFKPKLIFDLKVVYVKSKPQNQLKEETKKHIIPEMVECCSKLLINYGFSKNEALSLIDKAYSKNPTDSPSTLMKYILENLGEIENA